MSRALTATAVLLIGVVAWFDLHAWQEQEAESDIDGAREAAIEVAREAVPGLLSYQPETLDEDVQHARSLLTDVFAPEFIELQDMLIRPAVRRDLSTVATVDRIAVTSSAANEVGLLVFLEQTTTTGGEPAGEPVATRATVRLRLVDGTWLVDDLRPA